MTDTYPPEVITLARVGHAFAVVAQARSVLTDPYYYERLVGLREAIADLDALDALEADRTMTVLEHGSGRKSQSADQQADQSFNPSTGAAAVIGPQSRCTCPPLDCLGSDPDCPFADPLGLRSPCTPVISIPVVCGDGGPEELHRTGPSGPSTSSEVTASQ